MYLFAAAAVMLEISRLAKVAQPNAGIITKIGVSHIEHLGSREGILKAKCEILDGMAKGSTLIINGDNDMLATLDRDDYKLVRFGIDGDNLDMWAEDISSNALGLRQEEIK